MREEILDARANAAREAHLEQNGISNALPWHLLQESERRRWRETAAASESIHGPMLKEES